MRYLMYITYDGKNYSGYQKQPKGNTIQDELQKAIEIITKEKVTCVASGRTDAKVSAYEQPVHFDIDKELNLEKFVRSLNGILPPDIRVLAIGESDLHARFSAKKKTYVYKMYLSDVDMPLCNGYMRVPTDLDFKSMRKFCKLIRGTHDFVGFRASGGENDSTIRTIYDARLRLDDGFMYFTVTGNGFLYKMVRNLVGTMLAIGEGKLVLNKIKKTLFNGYKCTHTAKPDYLYLANVEY